MRKRWSFHGFLVEVRFDVWTVAPTVKQQFLSNQRDISNVTKNSS